MYLEIMTVGSAVEGCMSESRIFVGPFGSEDAREIFRKHWERQLDSNEHNPNQVKFLSCEQLPDGWGAILPRDFQGFFRITPEMLDDLPEE